MTLGQNAPTSEVERFTQRIADLTSRLEDLERRQSGRTTPWVNVTFQGAHVNFGGNTQPVQYRKQGDMVQIRGCFKTGAVGSTVFTLPVGFRPPHLLGFDVVSNNAFGRMSIVETTGAVTLDVGSTAFTWINYEFSIKG